MKNLKPIFFAVILILLSACSTERNKKIINLGLVDGWAEGVAMTNVAEVIMENQGYHVVIQRATPDMILASMNNGDTDLYMDVWLPMTHGSKVAKFKNIQELGTNYANARNGWVVPDYVPIQSIEDLKQHETEFKNQIVGIEKGAGITMATDRTIKEYGLNYKQINSSTVAMITELQNAIKEKRWIVVTAWQPHWMFGKMKLKFLDDPKKTLGKTEKIKTFARKDFEKDQPELAAFFSRIHFDDQTMSDLLSEMDASKNKKAVARKWVENHQTLVNNWLNAK